MSTYASSVPSHLGASDPPTLAADDMGEITAVEGEGEVEGEDAEEEECGFCLFMKGGGCKETFVAWEKCVEEAEKLGEDVVGKCSEATALLKKCMEAHAEYYEPILRAEEAMLDAAASDADAAASDHQNTEEHVEGKNS
ncbi:uncharacterized protein LOC121996077 [Zingiber officinale]|uniref:GCK domain-containing protein n=1 Tax=Zingiber officinale TaxID=94328 RepID=A0A8J5KWS0_ZINOF|nr:uncharacterized protein LOC121990804 [Zingiber officinale]XP_042405824.1 uncharacterized protein LOC121996077 [Zingiber officinale]KAG6499134.1 hypothetical protein ZIOFF_038890 [Zingiber officinale]